jgi:HlyD family secretion protein
MSWNHLFSKKTILVIILILVGLGILSGFTIKNRSQKTNGLITKILQKGELIATVTATGTIEPEEVVDIGAQVVGIIDKFGQDPTDTSKQIDFGSMVEPGTILALIDDSLYRARLDKAIAVVEQSKARVALAEADVVRAEANDKESAAKALQAERDFARAKRLNATGALAEQDFDAFKSSYEVTKAEIAVTKAAIRQAQATLNAAIKTQIGTEADQREAQRNLEYTIIRSPVKGVIVDRRVNVGQTVISSLNAPSLFLIAKDLKRLQVWASVNEADVGRIQKGQAVRFSVDAFPGEEFKGEVEQVRLNATMTQNVVTYTVVVTTDNPGGKLLPYLTATLKFEVGRRSGCLLVPNSALRWQPPSIPLIEQPLFDHGTVWVMINGSVKPVSIRTGLSDGKFTEVVEGELREGDHVVVGEKIAGNDSGNKNPFTPNIFGGKGK